MLRLPNVGLGKLAGKKGSYTLDDAKRDQRLSSPISSGTSVTIISPDEAEKKREENKKK